MTHKHHIIPKHEWKERFGTLDGVHANDNIVYLTIEQHSEVHKLLYEQYGRWEDFLASKGLDNTIGKDEFITLKQRLAQLGRKHSDETKRKIGIRSIGRKSHCQPHTQISKDKESETKSKIIWNIIDPHGISHSIRNVRKFCDERNLGHSHFYQMASGRKKSYKGWTCTKLENIL